MVTSIFDVIALMGVYLWWSYLAYVMILLFRNIADVSMDALAAVAAANAVDAVASTCLRFKSSSTSVLTEAMGLLYTLLASSAVMESHFSSPASPVVALCCELLPLYASDAGLISNVLDLLAKLAPEKYPCFASVATVRSLINVMQRCAADPFILLTATSILLKLLAVTPDCAQVNWAPCCHLLCK